MQYHKGLSKVRQGDNSNYYLNMKTKIMKDFDIMFGCARRPLKEHFSEIKINELYDESRREFAAFIPQLPYIGSKQNSGTGNLLGGAMLLAIIRCLEGQGLSRREIGSAIYETFEVFFKSRPRLLRCLMGKMMLSNYFIKKRKRQMDRSQLREYPEGFVSEFVEGDGADFDFGLNTVECAICKFYKKQGAEQYIPYLCLGDYAMFQALGIGFTRTQTIGNGAPKCDFRFKKGGETVRGWPPEGLDEWEGND